MGHLYHSNLWVYSTACKLENHQRNKRICSSVHQLCGGFPSMDVPQAIIHFRLGFSIKHPAIKGYHHFFSSSQSTVFSTGPTATRKTSASKGVLHGTITVSGTFSPRLLHLPHGLENYGKSPSLYRDETWWNHGFAHETNIIFLMFIDVQYFSLAMFEKTRW